jgi:hypothetical protein
MARKKMKKSKARKGAKKTVKRAKKGARKVLKKLKKGKSGSASISWNFSLGGKKSK